MQKFIEFVEKLATPLIIGAIIGLVGMYIQVAIMDYQITELHAWKATGERCTKEDCALMELRISLMERQIYRLQKEIKDSGN